MIRYKINYWILLTATTFCCIEPEKATLETHMYFGVKELLQEQVFLLDSLQPVLVKTAILEDTVETVSFNPDSAGWARELEIFQELDLNKASLRNKYDVDTIDEGDQKVVTFRSRNEVETGVDLLKVVMKNDKPELIVGNFRSESLLYTSERDFAIRFSSFDSLQALESYRVAGMQKMIWKDSVFFEIEGKTLFQ